MVLHVEVSRMPLFPSTGDMHTSACFRTVNKCNISKLGRFKFEDFQVFSSTLSDFKHFQGPSNFYSKFKLFQGRYEPCCLGQFVWSTMVLENALTL